MVTNRQSLAVQIRKISGVDPRKCMKCGKCTASCPSWQEMDISPHQFVSHVEKGEAERLLTSDTLWKCLSCFTCAERCPRGVEPANLIEAVRLCVIRKQNANRLRAETVPELLDNDLPQQAIASAFRKYSK